MEFAPLASQKQATLLAGIVGLTVKVQEQDRPIVKLPGENRFSAENSREITTQAVERGAQIRQNRPELTRCPHLYAIFTGKSHCHLSFLTTFQ